MLQPLYDGPYAVIRRSLHHFTLRIGNKEDKVSTLCLKPCTDPTATPAQPRVRGRLLLGFFPAQDRGAPLGALRPTAANRTAPGIVFPWPAARGFCTPRCSQPRHRLARPQPPSAIQIRPLGLRPRGLGGALWRLITASSQAKLLPPPPPQYYCASEWGSSHTHVLFQSLARQLEIHVQYFTASLIDRAFPRMSLLQQLHWFSPALQVGSAPSDP
jgi:hypothetical protein